MPIQAECPSCHHHYAASERMGGKRVRCKHCGMPFTLPLPADAMSASPFEVTEDAPPLDAPHEEGDPFASPQFRAGRDRRNLSFTYPGARRIDRGLPWALAGILVAWMVLETVSSDDTGLGWVVPTRVLVLLALYAGVVMPITLIGVRVAARKQHYELPEHAAWRVGAAFLLPFTLGYVLWLISGGIGALVAGTIAGLAFALGINWLLLRLAASEINYSLSAAAVAYVLGELAAILALFVINLTLNLALRGAHAADTLTGSPFGHNFAWVGAKVPPAVVAITPPAPDGENGPATLPADHAFAATEPGSTTLPATQFAGVVPAPAGLVPSKLPATAPAAATLPVIADAFKPPAPPPPPPSETDPFVVRLKTRDLRFVRDVLAPKGVGSFDQIIYPTIASSAVATMRHDQALDRLDIWETAGWGRTGSADLPHGEEKAAGRPCLLSPDGQLIVRIATFPKLSAQVWDIRARRVLHAIEIDGLGAPELIGFTEPDQFAIRWSRNGASSLELYDARAGTILRRIGLTFYPANNGNGELSPDGKLFAAVSQLKNKPALLLYDLSHPGPPRALALSGLDDRWALAPAGIAFNAGSSKIAAFFEHQGQGFIIAWQIRDGKLLAGHVCPAALPQEAPAAPVRLFDWIGDAAWLIHGTAIVDAGNGSLLAELTTDHVYSQRVVDGRDLELVLPADRTASNGGTSRLVVVRLDVAKLTAPVDGSQ